MHRSLYKTSVDFYPYEPERAYKVFKIAKREFEYSPFGSLLPYFLLSKFLKYL